MATTTSTQPVVAALNGPLSSDALLGLDALLAGLVRLLAHPGDLIGADDLLGFGLVIARNLEDDAVLVIVLDPRRDLRLDQLVLKRLDVRLGALATAVDDDPVVRVVVMLLLDGDGPLRAEQREDRGRWGRRPDR